MGQITVAGDALLSHCRRLVALEKARMTALRNGLQWDQPCLLIDGVIHKLRWWASALGHPPLETEPALGHANPSGAWQRNASHEFGSVSRSLFAASVGGDNYQR